LQAEGQGFEPPQLHQTLHPMQCDTERQRPSRAHTGDTTGSRTRTYSFLQPTRPQEQDRKVLHPAARHASVPQQTALPCAVALFDNLRSTNKSHTQMHAA
jgi:hypothetical protein